MAPMAGVILNFNPELSPTSLTLCMNKTHWITLSLIKTLLIFSMIIFISEAGDDVPVRLVMINYL